MNGLVMHISVALVWMFLSGNTGLGGLIGGLIAGFLLLSLFRRALFCEDYVRRVMAFLSFLIFFVKDVVISNFRLAILASEKDFRDLRGFFMRYDVAQLTEMEVVLLSHLIGLTPGTTVATYLEEEKELVLHVFIKGSAEDLRDHLEHGLVKHMLAFTR